VPDYTDEQLDQAVEALSDPQRFREAENVVARAAPKLQRILGEALATGGWFAESHESELGKAVAIEDADERRSALRIMLADETRLGMMVGVAVGWALATELAERDRERGG
jgi:hypothetical protein